ncbi:unnamed protein product [Soboliphyme baturini]|uniref:Uncharacterized protein n=1 Tax=Soboliphyme baturini TaxID=241478 RepID=A0A183IDK7_9BILA|nr:unnamed protein product [Soboliphyme baturini]
MATLASLIVHNWGKSDEPRAVAFQYWVRWRDKNLVTNGRRTSHLLFPLDVPLSPLLSACKARYLSCNGIFSFSLGTTSNVGRHRLKLPQLDTCGCDKGRGSETTFDVESRDPRPSRWQQQVPWWVKTKTVSRCGRTRQCLHIKCRTNNARLLRVATAIVPVCSAICGRDEDQQSHCVRRTYGGTDIRRHNRCHLRNQGALAANTGRQSARGGIAIC